MHATLSVEKNQSYWSEYGGAIQLFSSVTELLSHPVKQREHLRLIVIGCRIETCRCA